MDGSFDLTAHIHNTTLPVPNTSLHPQLTQLKEQKRELGEQLKALKSGKNLKSVRTRETGDKLSEAAAKALEKAEEKKCVCCVRQREVVMYGCVVLVVIFGVVRPTGSTVGPPSPTTGGRP